MTLILSGTDGLSDVDGSAATPAIRGTDANTGIFFPAADQVAITTGGTQRAVVDASGNVGIGTSSPATKFHVASGAVTVQGATSTTGRIGIFNNAASTNGFLIGQGFSSGTDNVGYVYNTANAAVAFGTNDIERMRIDSSGNVGIGTSSPSVKLDVAAITAVVQMDSSSGTAGAAVNRYKASNRTWVTGVNATDPTGAYTIYDVTASAERMRIDSSGNLLVGTTSSIFTTTKLQVTNSTTQTVGLQQTGGAANACVTSWNTATSGTIYQISFADGASGFVRGSITTNGTGTTYGTASDYRLKENIAPMTGALSVVQALKPVTYKWKSDGSEGQGFIAHELQEVVPQCVTGEKDAVDADGNPIHQGIDTSFLVATLTAAIQEQQAIITQLQADVAALKGTA